MHHPEGLGLQRADRLDSYPRARMEFFGMQLSSDFGLLAMRVRRLRTLRSVAS